MVWVGILMNFLFVFWPFRPHLFGSMNTKSVWELVFFWVEVLDFSIWELVPFLFIIFFKRVFVRNGWDESHSHIFLIATLLLDILRDSSRGNIMWYSTMLWRWSDSFDSSGRVKFGSKILPILIFESISWGRFWCETFERMSLDSLLSTVFFCESSWKNLGTFFWKVSDISLGIWEWMWS